MRCHVQVKDLLAALDVMCTVAQKRCPKPILQCVRIAASNYGGQSSVELSTTDLAVAVRVMVEPVSISKPGLALVYAHELRAGLKGIVGTVELDHEAETANVQAKLVVRCAGQELMSLTGYDADEFPLIKWEHETQVFDLGLDELDAAIGKVDFAAASEQGRYAMHSVCIEMLKELGQETACDGICFAATDGRRLSFHEIPAAVARPVAPWDGRKRLIDQKIPLLVGKVRKAMKVLVPKAPLLVKVYETWHYSTEAGSEDRKKEMQQERLPLSMSFVVKRTMGNDMLAQVVSNRVDGEFPRYRSVVPDDSVPRHRVRVERKALMMHLERFYGLQSEENRAVGFDPNQQEQGLRVWFQSPTRQASVSIPAQVTSANGKAPGSFALDSGMLIQALRQMDGEDAEIVYQERTMPVEIRLDPWTRYIQMPITIDV